jgi:RNA polymerase sigma factor (sigma-70 family)
MHEKSDSQLLREYAEEGNEGAFRELVTRHTDLVYSAALRQVTSPDLARDVAQSIFTDLARKARSLLQTANLRQSLAAWLYRGTRFAALNQLREERRRQTRERQAMEQFEPTLPETSNDWDRVRPLLDQAMAELSDEDREALLQRFFQGRDFRAIGVLLGVSDDAAQKRVSRALEKLRAQFARHGVTTTAMALASAISGHAVQAAPAGLAASLSTAALAGAGIASAATATATVTKTIAMTMMQKTLISATLAAIAGAGFYEANQAARLRDQVQALRMERAPLAEQIKQLQRERDGASNRLALLADENAYANSISAELLRLRAELSRLRRDSLPVAASKADGSPDAAEAASSWLNRVTQLKRHIEQTAGAKIPELHYLTEQDWLNAARYELNSEPDYRRAFSTLRDAAENKFALMIQKALKNYRRANQQMPTDMNQLQPYFDTPVDEAILQRWEVAPAETIQSLGLGGDVIITQRAPVDDVFDNRFGIGPEGTGSTDFLSHEVAKTMDPLYTAFKAEHNGHWPDDVSQLQPYVTTPEQQAAWQKLMLKHSSKE